MPDVGGFRRRLVDQAKQASHAAQRASQASLQRIEQFSTNQVPPGGAEAEEGASDADVAEEVSRLRAFLADRRPPPGPIQGR